MTPVIGANLKNQFYEQHLPGLSAACSVRPAWRCPTRAAGSAAVTGRRRPPRWRHQSPCCRRGATACWRQWSAPLWHHCRICAHATQQHVTYVHAQFTEDMSLMYAHASVTMYAYAVGYCQLACVRVFLGTQTTCYTSITDSLNTCTNCTSLV